MGILGETSVRGAIRVLTVLVAAAGAARADGVAPVQDVLLTQGAPLIDSAAPASGAITVAPAAPGADHDPDVARVAWLLGPSQDTVALSSAFLRAGYDVTRRDWDGSSPLSAMALPLNGKLVVYAAGMDAEGVTVLEGLLERSVARSEVRVLLVIDGCVDPEGAGGENVLPAPAERVGLTVAAPQPYAAGICPQSDMMAALAATLADAGAVLPRNLIVSGPAFGPLAVDTAPRVATPIVIGLGAVQPVTTVGVTPGSAASGVQIGLIGDAPVIRAAMVPPAGGGLQIAPVAVPTALPSAEATPEGRPRPSIIVGVIRTPGEAPAVDLDETANTGVTDTFELRARMRTNDPEAFNRFVTEGAFDPLPDALPAALQTVLGRMECYRLAIDGDWGNGSRSAVDRYYAERGDAAPTREATVELFRDVILREDIVCPAPAVVAAPTQSVSAPSQQTAPRPQATAQQPTAPVQQAPAAEAAPSGTIINPQFIGSFH